jgi:hypothetical protein
VLQVALVRKKTPPHSPEEEIEKTPKAETKSSQATQIPKNNKGSSEVQPNSTKSNEDLLIKSLSVIKHYNNSLFAVLKGAEIDIVNEEIRINCRFSFHKDRIMEQRNTNLIEKAFSKVYGKGMHLSVGVDNNKPEKIDPAEEVVKSAAAIFGAEVTDA